MSKLVQTQHFKFKKPYTVESVLKSHEFHLFRAKMAADANGISEEISISVPIMKSDANFEILFMETYPKIKKAKNLLSWTWPITFSKMSLCLADNLAESFDAIVDQNFPNQNQKTGANFMKALSLLTSKAINCPNPRDDVVELLARRVSRSLMISAPVTCGSEWGNFRPSPLACKEQFSLLMMPPSRRSSSERCQPI